MPAIPKGSKVFVTGANGFIAAATCRILIEHGFQVVGAVRTAHKGEWLANKLGKGFTFHVVPDIEKPDAFDEAIKVVKPDAVLHMASPVSMTPGETAEGTIGPAVSGTTGILNSVRQFGETVRRIVVTSSVAALMEPKDGPYTYTEADWNETSAALVEREGIKAGGVHVYRASKVLAEKAAWKFVADNKSSISFDLVTILPPLVYGPLEQEPPSSPAGLNLTMGQIFQNFTNPPPPVPGFSLNLIDVRDVALAHVLALEKEEAGGERFIPSNGPFTWAELRDYALAAGVPGVAPGTTPGSAVEPPLIIVDGSKAARVLGLKYRPKSETAVDAIRSIYELVPGAAPKA